MRPQTTPNFTPDGMGNGLNAAPVRIVGNLLNTQPQTDKKTEQQNDGDRDRDYDDGLVHSHGWARATNRKN